MPPRDVRARLIRIGSGLALALGLACAQRGGSSLSSSEPASAEPLAKASSTPPASSTAPAPEQTASAADAAQSGRLEEGRRLYEQYCKLCHGADATGYAADNAPSLVSQTFLESASNEFIAHGIRMGRPNTPMAAYGKNRGGPLDDAQIGAIVAWLRSRGPSAKLLPPVSLTGDPKRGAQLFEKHCQSCHGTEQKRASAPQLHNPEWLATAPPAFIRHAIVNGRPPTPMLSFSGRLSGPEIDDLVALFVSLKPSQPSAPVQNTKVPENLPVIINPKGGQPEFSLRDGRFVASDQVKKALDGKRRMVIVDARSPADWIQFHIPGSIPVPYHDVSRLERIPNDGTWVIAYCACPHHASGVVVDLLRQKGYQNTAVLDEGILYWRERGYPLAGEAVKPDKPAGPGVKPAAKP
jgi:mono/diheme cytochrome c family protein/rhodanese-related sulfurtransferase